MRKILLLLILVVCTSFNEVTIDYRFKKIESDIEKVNEDLQKIDLILNDPERLRQIQNNNR